MYLRLWVEKRVEIFCSFLYFSGGGQMSIKFLILTPVVGDWPDANRAEPNDLKSTAKAFNVC